MFFTKLIIINKFSQLVLATSMNVVAYLQLPQDVVPMKTVCSALGMVATIKHGTQHQRKLFQYHLC